MSTIADKIRDASRSVAASLVERDDEVHALFCAALAGEGVLITGVPGTAKSLLARNFAAAFDCTYADNDFVFEYLLTRFTDPTELFGPVDIKALKAGNTKRHTKGFLPSAIVLFIDECFKGSSAILNTLLGVLNERQFRYGTQKFAVPMRMFVGASNEMPTGEHGQQDLAALFDRFLVRKEAKTVRTRAGFERLLFAPDADFRPKPTTPLSVADLDLAAAEAMNVPFGNEAREAMLETRDALSHKDVAVFPGDRRWRKSVKLCKAAAYMGGAASVEPPHLEILADCLWTTPGAQQKTVRDVVLKTVNPVGAEVAAALAQAAEIVQSVTPGDVNANVTAVKKLAAIHKELKGKGAAARKALDYVAAEGKRLRSEYMNATAEGF